MSWYQERLHGDFRQSILRLKSLYKSQTKFQKIEIFENQTLGRVLVLDDVVQATEADEAHYHEMLVHVPGFALENISRVLILGGGAGGALREILRHAIEAVTLVDIDGEVVSAARRYFPSLSAGCFDDSRVTVHIQDGVNYLKETREQFDLIIVDSTDPIGPGKVLFETNFYSACRACLAPGGVLVTQNGVPFLQSEELVTTNKNMKSLFVYCGFYFTSVPTYFGGMMALAWASEATDLSQMDKEMVRKRFAASSMRMRYYTPDIHFSAFAMPQRYIDLLESKASS